MKDTGRQFVFRAAFDAAPKFDLLYDYQQNRFRTIKTVRLFSVHFNGRPQVVSTYRAWPNLPFNAFLVDNKQKPPSTGGPPQNIRTAQKGPYVRKIGSDGVAKRERRHSEFCLDALVVVEVDIAVNHGVGFA